MLKNLGLSALALTLSATLATAGPLDIVNVAADEPINYSDYFANIGDAFTLDAAGDTWGHCPFSSCVTFGDGSHSVSSIPDEALTIGAYTFNRGSLIGQIGTGDYFLVGTSFSGTATASGQLKLLMWDDSYSDNSGGIQVQVGGLDKSGGASAVPLPAGLPLLLGGVGLFALLRRRA